ncbi:MAG: hypothetical protein WBD82_02135 [Acidimicrobiales bacterium]
MADLRHTTRFVDELELSVAKSDVVIGHRGQLLAQKFGEHTVVFVEQRDEFRPS